MFFRSLTLLLLASIATAQEADEESSEYTISFGGQYRVVGDASNFDFHPRNVSADAPAQSFVNQRFRTWVNFHDRDERDHGVYFQVEIGHVAWGDDLDFPKTYEANGSEVGIELRRGFLWYKPSEHSLLRVGILDWRDSFGERPVFEDPLWAVDEYDTEEAPLASSVWDFNVGGVRWDFTTDERWHTSLGAVVLSQGDTIGGDGSALLFSGDVERELDSTILGTSAYYLRDRGGYSYGDFGGPRFVGAIERSWDLWLGLRGHHEFGRWKPSYFFIWNRGETAEPQWEHSGWAVKGDLDYALDHTRLRLRTFYASGNDHTSPTSSGEFRTIAQSARDNFGAQSYWSLLGLSSPRGPSDVNDLGVGLQNRGLGLRTVQGAVEQRVSRKTSLYAALGWLSSAEKKPVSASSDMGVELLGETRFSLSGAMGLDVGRRTCGPAISTAPSRREHRRRICTRSMCVSSSSSRSRRETSRRRFR